MHRMHEASLNVIHAPRVKIAKLATHWHFPEVFICKEGLQAAQCLLLLALKIEPLLVAHMWRP